jgi:4-aminobutyrate aminotransferase / (S)-3-amino-2-methylpropionate transaminase / 5-aminovalerate transaminase
MATADRLPAQRATPETDRLLARREAAVPRGVAVTHPVAAERASGARLTDADGRTFIDFTGGIGTLNVGHSHPKVVAAVEGQVRRFTHTCFPVAAYEPYVALCERLNALVPGPGPKKTLLVNSGAEAVENAVKIARAATGRPAVVAFEHAFHGRTLLGMTLTGKVFPYKAGFGPFAPEVYRAPYPYCFRCPRAGGAHCCQASPDWLTGVLATQVAPRSVAAVIVEPVAGEGGFIPAPPEVMRGLAAWCRANGAVFIVDEIQTGFGRTGRMFAMEHAGVHADITVMAKSLAGGLPLAAVTGRADLMDAPEPGGLGSTYGGNPVACAAALAVLDVFEEERLVERAARIGAAVGERFAAFKARFPFVGDARGLGAMRALEIVKAGGEPDPDRAKAIVAEARRRGLLVLTAGMHANVIRALMPLVIDDATLAEGLDILEAALAAA